MNRRSFLRLLGLAPAAAIAAPLLKRAPVAPEPVVIGFDPGAGSSYICFSSFAELEPIRTRPLDMDELLKAMDKLKRARGDQASLLW